MLYVGTEIAIRVFHAVYSGMLLGKNAVISPANIDFSLMRQMIFYGTNTFLYVTGALIICKSSDIIIGIFMTTADITRFSIVMMVALLLSQFTQSFTQAIKPAISDLDARGETMRIREIALLTQKYILIPLIPAVLFLIVMGPEFLRMWMGPEYEGLSGIMTILVVGHFFRLAQHGNFMVLVGKGEHKIFGMLTAIMAAACVILAVISVKTLKLGLLGIALSNLLPILLICGIILPIYAGRRLNISFTDSMRHVWLPAIAACSPAAASIGIWKYFYPPTSWFCIAMVIVSAGLLTALGTWLFGLTNVEKKRFCRILCPSG